MKKSVITSILSVLLTTFILFSCKKINEATTLGGDLIPAVDNIHTFDTTLEVFAYNHMFEAAADTFKSLASDEQFLGKIDNDPIFGKTDAQLFFQVAIPSNKYAFGNAPGKNYIDSVVLCLKYTDTYGDTLTPQTISVYELSQSNSFLPAFIRDSAYKINQNNWVTSSLLGTKSVLPKTLKDSIFHMFGADSTTANELRIKLDNSFGTRLLNYDSTNAYLSDSAFKTFFKGFALRSAGGNALMGFNLTATNTRLAIYYRYDDKTTAGKLDTTVAYFGFGTGNNANANYIGRDYAGTSIPAATADNNEDQLLYVQNAPGPYASIKIPGLNNLSNRIVHRAELMMESVYDPTDTLFNAPPLFLDVQDTTTTAKFMTVPYSFVYGQGSTGALSGNYSGFGCYPFSAKDPAGNIVKQWRFDLTRYVQFSMLDASIPNKKIPVYNFRLYSIPSFTLPLGTPGVTASIAILPWTNLQALVPPAKGRVRLAGGHAPSQKMKLRIVYSKL